MLTLKLAFRHIFSRGLRTWLNVIVLSVAFVAIIWTHGLFEGMNRLAMHAMIDTELGGGQFWHEVYDPYDPLTLEEARTPLSDGLVGLVAEGWATPVLITAGAIFPEGRVQNALLKGIDPQQEIIDIPADKLAGDDSGVIPGLIGKIMAERTNLHVGDYVTVRWRDASGMFDAADVQIVHVMSTIVQTVDAGQIWIPLETLRGMLGTPDQATLVVLEKDIESIPPETGNWVYRDLDFLLKNLTEIIEAKKVGSMIFYGLLLAMALLAIFDTQVLAIFRRRREMGTLMALGMTRGEVIRLFTLEGALHGFLALLVGAVYGIPLMWFTATRGLPLPAATGEFGMALPDRLYASYSLGLLAGSTLLVLLTVTIVSFLPTRKITRLKPTDALRGRLT
jgi:ABC-type lipoprotein release transport system permease subunit